MEAIPVLTLFIGAIAAYWFGWTLNGIHRQLQYLNEKSEKQLLALGYKEKLMVTEDVEPAETEICMYCPKCKVKFGLEESKNGKCPECKSRMSVSRRLCPASQQQ